LLQKRKDTKSINQINFMAILFAGVFAFISACLVIVNEYIDFQKEIKIIEENYIQTQQNSAEAQLLLLHNITQYRFSQSQGLSKEQIYQKLKEDMKALIPSSDGQNYLFLELNSGKVLYRSAELPMEDVGKDIVVTERYAPLDLILGSGVSTHNVENVLEQKKKAYQDKIINFVLKIYMLTLFLYLVSTVEYRYVSDIMKREIRFIVYSFKKASQSYEFIDMEKIKFQEFQEIVTHANVMIEEIKAKNSALVELNSNLEGIVEQKTVELKRSIDFTQELLEKQDRFVKNAIHEINTPLSIILMNIDLYNLKFETNPYLLKIEAAVKVLDNIYEDLAYVVKKDRVVYEKSMVNFSTFLEERVDYFEDVAQGNKLHINTNIAPELFILFNETELQRICDNNLSNAIKYSYEQHPLHVRLYERENEIVFEVENCGEMIKSPDQLFNRYYREDEARGGFGLGLNIVKEICDENEVSIDVLSDEVRTLFRYRFLKG
jgi:signal transduction histidine kinase